ncbi:MAG: cytidylate kinase family protein [Magnetococcales bacterium]|nr:cytidylate kinase family protein [Magnetococcales bacterium]
MSKGAWRTVTLRGADASSDEDRSLGILYRKGEVILRQGDHPEAMYSIQRGLVEAVMETRYGEEHLGILKQGDICGTVAVILKTPQVATFRALVDTRVIKLDGRNVITRMHQDPSLAFRVISRMARHINDLDRKMQDTLHSAHAHDALPDQNHDILSNDDEMSGHSEAEGGSSSDKTLSIPMRRMKAPLVTISRDFGAGGGKIGAMLAERLGAECFDNQIVDRIADTMHFDHDEVEDMDDRIHNHIEEWLHAIVAKEHLSRQVYWRGLVRIVRDIAENGGVIIGRGAHLILADRHLFRLRLTGSLELCSRRVQVRTGLGMKRSRKLVKTTNHEREEFVRKLYKRFPTHKTYYDLVLSTDDMPEKDVVDVILFSMKRMGFHLPNGI